MKSLFLRIIFLMVCLGVSSKGYATSFQFPNFSGATAAGMLVLNGDSTINGSNLRIVPNATFQVGGAWYYIPVTLEANKAFSTAFAFNFTGNEADGMTFCIHNDSRGTAAYGNWAGDLGYGYDTEYASQSQRPGISDSIAVEYDVYDNGSVAVNGVPNVPDGTASHIAILDNGVSRPHLAISSGTWTFVGTGNWYNWIDYDGTTLEVRVSQTDTRPTTASLSYAVNINTKLGNPSPSQAYVGFTGGTGGVGFRGNILRWRFVDSYWPMTTTKVPALTSAISYAVYDPGNTKKKAIPGEDVVTTLTVTNSGGQPFADSVTNVINVPTNLAFKVGSVSFTANTSGLTCCGTAGNVLYSSTGTSGPWTYTPTGTYDSNVRAIKYTPTGTMATGHSTSVSYSVAYTAQIQ